MFYPVILKREKQHAHEASIYRLNLPEVDLRDNSSKFVSCWVMFQEAGNARRDNNNGRCRSAATAMTVSICDCMKLQKMGASTTTEDKLHIRCCPVHGCLLVFWARCLFPLY